MAARVLLLSILFTVGFWAGGSKGLDVGLQFGVEPSDCVVSRNKPALLPCSSPTQNVSFSWTLDDRPLPLLDNSRVQLLANGSLYFKKVFHKKSGHGQSDQGAYRCVIRSPLGALVSRPARLRFAWMSHEFLESGRSVAVVEGDPARLPCFIDSLPAAEISWERDSSPLPRPDRYIILDNGTLIMTRVQKDDQGDFRCTAWNSLVNKTRVSEVSKLTVEGRQGPSVLEIVQPVSDIRANWTEGQTVSLVCLARGTPTPQLKWTKLQPDQSSGLVSNVTEGVNVLTIHNVSSAHAGVYTCVASQVISDRKTNTVSITKEVTVEQILRPPVITKMPKSQTYPVAKTVRLQCEAEGNPPPEVVWYRDGQRLLINGRIKLKKELVLSNTVSKDSGMYQCVASNSVGSAWTAARLLVNVSRDQPWPPSPLACSPVSSSAVHLSWEIPAVQGLKAFTIHYLPTNGGEERMSVTEALPNQMNQTFTVDKLSPYTNFTFYIRSYNTNGASDNSDEIVCQTGEAVPSGVPAVTAVPQSAMTVLVEWEPLAASVARGVVSEHKVLWRRRQNPSTHVDLVAGNVTRYLITGLTPETEYEVRVLAATAKGWPNLSEQMMPWTLVKTPSLEASTPLLPPPLVQLTVINATSIQVRWTLVSDLLRVEGFRLSYRKHNSQPSSPIQLSANTSVYTLLDLEPQTWYEVQVKALSGNKEGEVGVQAINTLPLQPNATAVPTVAAPTNLEAVPTSPSSINLTWDSPAGANYFTIRSQIVSTSIHGDDNNTYFLHSTYNGVQVTGLKPYTLYELNVRTHDLNNRVSEYSQSLECRTLEDVPERVQEVEWKPLNSSSVRVMWKAPNVTNGPISGHSISFTSRPHLPPDQWKHVLFQGTRPAADVTGLSPNLKYSLVVRAATKAGLGSPSPAIEVFIPTRERPPTSTTPSFPPPTDDQQSSNDQFLGIVLGCTIGGCCVLLCMASLIYRRQCSKPRSHSQCRPGATNGAPCFHSTPNHLEMQCLPSHLDTKGGHPNGEVNGLKLPLLSNGRLPNGLLNRDRSVRITENPQFECGVSVSCEELRQPSDEADSLLSGHSLNDTQLTAMPHLNSTTPAQQQLFDKHEPDDGFHESHQPVVGPNG